MFGLWYFTNKYQNFQRLKRSISLGQLGSALGPPNRKSNCNHPFSFAASGLEKRRLSLVPNNIKMKAASDKARNHVSGYIISLRVVYFRDRIPCLPELLLFRYIFIDLHDRERSRDPISF